MYIYIYMDVVFFWPWFCTLYIYIHTYSGTYVHTYIHTYITKGSLGYLSSMYFSTSLVLGEVAGPFPEIEN